MKVAILSSQSPNFKKEFFSKLPTSENKSTIEKSVSRQIALVKKNKDQGLISLVRRYDGWQPKKASALRVSQKAMQQALGQLPPKIRRVLTQASRAIKAFAIKQACTPFTLHNGPGSWCAMRVVPVNRVGIYVPGGTAIYPSTLLMSAIPATIAGVSELAVVHPAKDGKPSQLILATAALCNISELYLAGGAGAIAALAHGTPTIKSVDKIVGPGNQWVAEAKRQVFGTVGIDMLAGPTEVVVVFDASADPEVVASDLLAQAEHDSQARAIGITPSKKLAMQVQEKIITLTEMLSRKKIITASFSKGSFLTVAKSIQEAISLANEIAPEHLHIHTKNAKRHLSDVRSAGSIFLGGASAESFGDYCAGPNHTLPTNRCSRFQSPLGTYDFQVRQNVVHLSPSAASRMAPLAASFAELEGLDAHALGASLRLKKTRLKKG